jgi:hypothetical protein
LLLKATCPVNSGANVMVPLDTTTPNAYYSNLLSQKGLLHSDQELFNGSRDPQLVVFFSSQIGKWNVPACWVDSDQISREMEKQWAPNPIMVTLPPGVGDDDGDAASGVEAEGGVRDRVGNGDGATSREVASREVAVAPR